MGTTQTPQHWYRETVLLEARPRGESEPPPGAMLRSKNFYHEEAEKILDDKIQYRRASADVLDLMTRIAFDVTGDTRFREEKTGGPSLPRLWRSDVEITGSGAEMLRECARIADDEIGLATQRSDE